MLSHYAGMQVHIIDAQKQARTPRDVRGPWVRPKVPSKLVGRKGTRRQWKRANAPHWTWLYREPTDVLVLRNREILMTPQQADILKNTVPARPIGGAQSEAVQYFARSGA